MGTFISTEIEADQIVELMLEGPHFAEELWEHIAIAIDQGLLLDNAADGAMVKEPNKVKFIATMLRNLSTGMVNGYNIGNVDKIELEY